MVHCIMFTIGRLYVVSLRCQKANSIIITKDHIGYETMVMRDLDSIILYTQFLTAGKTYPKIGY